MFKLALISGSWPPEACGVGDYTAHIGKAMANIGVEVVKIGNDKNKVKGILLPAMMTNADIVHIQYPTMGYGRSLSPAMIPLLKRNCKICVTIHEFSNFKTIRRPWFLTFAHMVNARIFTNDEEKKAFYNIMRPRSGSDDVIPIASNIRQGLGTKVPGSVCNFGLLTPNKGIEEFIQLASLAEGLKDLSFALIGAKTNMYGSYADEIIRECNSRGISTHINLPDDALAELLSTFEFAYLPFPDGASSKRGSLLALQKNGVRILTTHTALTQENIRTSTIAAPSPKHAKDELEHAINEDHRLLGMRSLENANQPPGWDEIGIRHLEIYKKIL